MDDSRVLSGILLVILKVYAGAMSWRLWSAQDYLQPFIRWSRPGVFNRILPKLVARGGDTDYLMIDATHLKRALRIRLGAAPGKFAA